MKSVFDLEAWKIGLELLKEVYALTERLPDSEKFEMKSQLRRAAKSILANLAEGFSKRSPKDKANKYTIARGECTETCAFLLMISEIYFPKKDVQGALDLADREGRLLSGLIYAQEQRLKTYTGFHPPSAPIPVP